METINTDDFMLQSETAKVLYNQYAKKYPIVDYHSHVIPQEIFEDRRYDNITQLWLGGDHYKWRLMRAAGINEDLITGNAPDIDKFKAFAEVVGLSIGNPICHWCCLELKRYFDIDTPLSGKTWKEIWDITEKKLKSGEVTARSIIRDSNVELLCTTDDPADDLNCHIKINEDKTFDTVVLPTFRPDNAVDIQKDTFKDYIDKLSKVSNIEIKDLDSMKKALSARMDFFEQTGCRLADHGTEFIYFEQGSKEEIDQIISKALNGQKLTDPEIAKYKTELFIFCAEEYSKRKWTMQLHFGCIRDTNRKMFEYYGPNVGCDAISGGKDYIRPLSRYFDHLTYNDIMPDIIVYSLDPEDNVALDTLIGCFTKVRHGAAWWFNDQHRGMEDHLTKLAAQTYFPSFPGMLTDSRCFLSYTRHEYFRRILCNLMGDYVEKNMFPKDFEALSAILEKVCYLNAAKLFKLK